jgi:hypothetical protein
MSNLEENDFKPDFEIADRYINFSSELLRLSLFAISGIGALIILYIEKKEEVQLTDYDKWWIILIISLFALTAGVSLFHRFYASDSMSYHIAYLRKKTQEEKDGRTRCLKRAEKSLILAEYLFGLAIIVFVIALFQFLMNR